CVRLAERIAPARATGIHRDLHPEQVLVRRDGGIVLLDLDLFAWGDPLIDVANFAAHLVELGVREHGDAAALDDARAVFEETWLRLQAHALRRDLERHRALAIARHVAISQRIPARRATTEAVLAAAEGALAAERVL
ncbi:MAG: phosphotransferase, partial [Myxococcales bacterium]|nr:phosphotransferase [Myxococcales bacterium]